MDSEDEEAAAYQEMYDEQQHAQMLAQQEQVLRENNDGEDGRALRRRYGIALKGTSQLFREFKVCFVLFVFVCFCFVCL